MKPTNNQSTSTELLGDPRRQAIPSISGIVYQAWCSIDAWLRLDTPDQVIYLEGAEDFDITTDNGAIAVQVKHNKASISLGSAKAIEALENFWKLTTQEPTRQVDFHYITTSRVVKERNGTFGNIAGLDAWRAASTNTEIAKQLAGYLEYRLKKGSQLQEFLKSAPPEELQKKLFLRFHWMTDQPGIEAVKQSVESRITILLHQQGKSISLASKVRTHLESHFWQTVIKNNSAERCLTFSELLIQIEDAITTYLPISLDKIPDLIAGTQIPGLRLLQLIKNKAPKPPAPLLQRSGLVSQFEEAINQRRSILLTGTVFKGKTTVAQLVANNLTLEAWWFNLTSLSANQVNILLVAIAEEIDTGSCPSLIVIDDLDISPIAHRAYRDSLGIVLHRLKASGRGALITAQGGSSEAAQLSEFEGIEIFEIPELTKEEVTELCVQEGCPKRPAEFWGEIINAFSRGHPKLVQVRIAELAEKNWPLPTPDDFGMTSSAADSVRQRARRLLSDSVSQEVVTFLYTASESTTLLHRSVAMKLAEIVGGIQNPGDLLDDLAGRWIECVEIDWFRTTSILNGAASDVWTPERRLLAHIQLHDAFVSKGTLDPAEAAAMLFHAYFGREPRRISVAALKLQSINDTKAKDAVERNLLWLPYVALEDGQNLCDEHVASATLRSLQFKVAVTLDSDTLPKVCARWIDETAQVQQSEMKECMSAMMWPTIVIADSQKIPLTMRLKVILELSCMKLNNKLAKIVASGFKSFLQKNDPLVGVPANGNQTQTMLVLCMRWVVGLDALRELIEWLDLFATGELRKEFDSIIEWPLVQSQGAFVQTAWVAEHEKVLDWLPWLDLFDSIDSFAKRRGSPALGREAAKAKAIILTEYLSRSQEALEVLSSAEVSFGRSAVLDEQKANVLFQSNDDTQVLVVWSELVANSSNQFALDPFAYRRAAISATRLKNWEKAEEIFREAIASIDSGSYEWTRFGLIVDCALTVSLGGDQLSATELLSKAVLSLPDRAAEEGDSRWEASQRAASEVCSLIERAIWSSSHSEPKIEPGYASSPLLNVTECETGQAMRTAMLRAMVAKLCACLGVPTNLLDPSTFHNLVKSRYLIVRWISAQALLAKSFYTGAGEDFIPAILRFDETFFSITKLGKDGYFVETSPEHDISINPEKWFGLLVAGGLCAESNIDSHLTSWLTTCEVSPTNLDGLAKSIRQLQEGSLTSTHLLKKAIYNTQNSNWLRCGAAIKLLQEPMKPEEVLELQMFLTSAIVSEISYSHQEVYNHHLCVLFAKKWEMFVQNPFNFPTPKIAVPILSEAIKNSKNGNASLRSLLKSAAQVMGMKLGEFMDRVH